MKRVLIISTSYDEKKQIEEVIRVQDPGSFELEVTASFGQEPSFWTLRPPQILVLNLPEDEELQGYFIKKIKKDLPKDLPIVVLCNGISSALMQLSQNFSKLRFFKLPLDAYAVFRSLIDLTTEYKKGQTQIHPRYQTDQAVQILSEFFEGQITAIMKNLSKSGAYLESDPGVFSISPGDIVKVAIETTSSKKQYIFDVKIVWSKQRTDGTLGYGVTFVNREEVYNSLLKNLG